MTTNQASNHGERNIKAQGLTAKMSALEAIVLLLPTDNCYGKMVKGGNISSIFVNKILCGVGANTCALTIPTCG